MGYKKILVTGADGFIGSHLVEKLIGLGFSVKAFVNYNFQNHWGWLDHVDEKIKKEVEVVSGDIRDPDCIKTVIDKCDYVFNLAALIGIPYSYRAPKSYIDTNLIGLLNLMNAVKEKNNTRIIHTSTSEVYGTASFVPMTEEHPLNAQSPYAASKIAADQLAISFFKSFNLPISIIRPFNTYGPRQSLRAIIPTIITQIAMGYKELYLGDLTPTRDFSFVQDTCQGLIAIAEAENAIGETINIGSNFEISMSDTLNIIKDLMSSDIKFIEDKQRIRPENSEVFRLWCDNSKIHKITGFKPEINISEGLQRTIDWIIQPKNLKKYKAEIYNV